MMKRILFFLLAIWIASPLVFAREEVTAGAPTAAEADTAPAPPPEVLNSPRSTMATFLHTMNDYKRKQRADIDPAIATMDLSGISKLVRKEESSDRAWMLLEVLDRTRVVDLKKLPKNSNTRSPYIFSQYDKGKVALEKQEDGRWLFSKDTVIALPDILDELTRKGQEKIKVDAGVKDRAPLHIRLRTQMPESLRNKVLLLENWQWLAGFLIVFVGVIADKLTSLLFKGLVIAWNRSRYWVQHEALPADILRPLGLSSMAAVWWAGINFLGLDVNFRLILLVAVKLLASISAVWGAYRLVDIIKAILAYRASKSVSKLDDALVPLFTRTLKIFVTIIGLLFIASNLSIDITGLIAGLGLGGLAFALAAKDIVQNLFGSVTVLTDRTFMVGDWIVVGEVEGTVEQVGFRSTRIRTFYNSVITVPNAKFITANVDNMGERQYRRYKTNVAVAYDTPVEKIDRFCEGMRNLVRRHPDMRKDYFEIYLNELSESSLDILVYVFFRVPDWDAELKARHEFILSILQLAENMKIELAFPTRTLYLHHEPEQHGKIPVEKT